jgi:hypothetical protein
VTLLLWFYISLPPCVKTVSFPGSYPYNDHNTLGHIGTPLWIKRLTSFTKDASLLWAGVAYLSSASRVAKAFRAFSQTEVHTLDLSKQNLYQLGAKGVVKLFESLSDTKITTLDLRGNQFWRLCLNTLLKGIHKTGLRLIPTYGLFKGVYKDFGYEYVQLLENQNIEKMFLAIPPTVHTLYLSLDDFANLQGIGDPKHGGAKHFGEWLARLLRKNKRLSAIHIEESKENKLSDESRTKIMKLPRRNFKRQRKTFFKEQDVPGVTWDYSELECYLNTLQDSSRHAREVRDFLIWKLTCDFQNKFCTKNDDGSEVWDYARLDNYLNTFDKASMLYSLAKRVLVEGCVESTLLYKYLDRVQDDKRLSDDGVRFHHLLAEASGQDFAGYCDENEDEDEIFVEEAYAKSKPALYQKAMFSLAKQVLLSIYPHLIPVSENKALNLEGLLENLLAKHKGDVSKFMIDLSSSIEKIPAWEDGALLRGLNLLLHSQLMVGKNKPLTIALQGVLIGNKKQAVPAGKKEKVVPLSQRLDAIIVPDVKPQVYVGGVNEAITKALSQISLADLPSFFASSSTDVVQEKAPCILTN